MLPQMRAAVWVTAIATLVVACVAACDGPPSLLCDHARVVWPTREIEPADDVSPDPGIQVDLVLKTTLLPGTRGFLGVQGEDDEKPVVYPGSAVADQDGTISFSAVDVPYGNATLLLTVENDCGQRETSHDVFVWDGLGMPRCDLTPAATPADVAFYQPLQVLRAEHDADDQTPGLQMHFTASAGRPDMKVTLFALDVAGGAEQALAADVGEDGTVGYDLTLGEGEQALRAVCQWTAEDLRPSSATLRYWVDTEPPDCALTAPTRRQVPGDDTDAGQDGIQFPISGHAGAADAVGEPALFEADGQSFDGGIIDDSGDASATATVPDAGAQVLVFSTQDHAGNPCSDTATY